MSQVLSTLVNVVLLHTLVVVMCVYMYTYMYCVCVHSVAFQCCCCKVPPLQREVGCYYTVLLVSKQDYMYMNVVHRSYLYKSWMWYRAGICLTFGALLILISIIITVFTTHTYTCLYGGALLVAEKLIRNRACV